MQVLELIPSLAKGILRLCLYLPKASLADGMYHLHFTHPGGQSEPQIFITNASCNHWLSHKLMHGHRVHNHISPGAVYPRHISPCCLQTHFHVIAGICDTNMLVYTVDVMCRAVPCRAVPCRAVLCRDVM